MRSGLTPALAAVLGAVLSAGILVPTSEARAECEPGFSKLRFNDDLSCYRHADRETLVGLDRLKAIPLDGRGGLRLSFGGDIRQRYEFTEAPGFGADPQDKRGVWLQRYILHGEVSHRGGMRAFVQGFSALENGRQGGPSPVDQNTLTLQNAFIEMARDGASIRAGRQELNLGSGRLVDVREGPNVRRTFDALQTGVTVGSWQVDGLFARPRQALRDAFDDEPETEQRLWGVYATADRGLLPWSGQDIYYLGFRDTDISYEQGSGRETRHSVGTRLFGERDGWDWNWEAIGQFGTFGGADIRAWTMATETGRTFAGAPWSPRLAVSANVASGDSDGNDDTLGSFNALFPRGNYFSEAAVLGPRNFFNIHPFITVSPTDRLSLTADVNVFWRLETEDGVYAPNGGLIRASGGSDERYVGSAISLSAAYAVTPRFEVGAIYTHFFTGNFLEATGASQDIDFVEVTARFRF